MPKSELPIVIAGAGPAGSALAIRLRSLGLPVVLIERYKFPRQKLCGEFISPECLAHFSELGVLDEMLSAGGDLVLETKFYASGGRSITVPTKWFGSGAFALSLSRARMDQILLDRARFSGAVVMDETAVTGLLAENNKVLGVRVRAADGRSSEICSCLTVEATGRGRVLSRFADKLNEKVDDVRPGFVGFKAHLVGVEMRPGVCEIYGFRGGYAGLSFVEGGVANLCFLAKSSLLKNGSDADVIVSELQKQNGRARHTLNGAAKTHDWLAVSVPRFGFNSTPTLEGLVNIGDAAAFIDPFTGSGMLMAMESAQILAKCVSENAADPDSINTAYVSAHRQRFRSRLRTSGLIRHLAYVPACSSAAVRMLSLSERLRAGVARSTRPAGTVSSP